MSRRIAEGSRLHCPECTTELSAALLNCPGCGWLVHGDELRRLATEAERANSNGAESEALGHWRTALSLLPPDSKQYRIISTRVEGLSRGIESSGESSATPAGAHQGLKMPSRIAGLGIVGLFVWKFKFVLVFIVTKAKFLLFGLSKAGTLSSMLLSVGVYWTIWGWKFAAGLVLSIYVHEMGHVAALRKYGIPATAPTFIPGLGAFIRLKQHPFNAREDARVGLAGPNWGLAAALACAAAYGLTREPYWAVIAGVGAWINVFNLTPVLGLDGDRAFRPMTRLQRILAMVVTAAVAFATGEGILFLVLIVGAVQCMDAHEKEGDWRAFGNYVFLVIALTVLSMIRTGVAE